MDLYYFNVLRSLKLCKVWELYISELDKIIENIKSNEVE